MADVQTACSAEYFNGRNNIGYSISQITPVIDGVTGNVTFKATRPFIPIVGVNSVSEMESMANNNAVKQMFYNLMENALNASSNNALGNGALPKINDGDPLIRYSQYLYKKCVGNAGTGNQVRYLSQGALVTSFWNNIDLANTPQQYYDEVSKLIERVKTQFDQVLYTAPGEYEFDSADSFAVDWKALVAATGGSAAGILCLEISSI